MPNKKSIVTWYHRWIANPFMKRCAGYLPGQALLETTGRRTGKRRHTPIGGRRTANTFWFVSDHGTTSNYMRNIEANNAVRVKFRGRWHEGRAIAVPADDAKARLRNLPRFNSLMVRLLGTDLLTVRVDLDPPRT